MSVFSSKRPLVMGILNVTPDSFFDGGAHFSRDEAVAHGLAMVGEGADIIDVGGESTRPGAQPVGVEEEISRVVPVIEKLRAETSALISVDTGTPEVMRAAADAGANMINDVRALQREGALAAAASTGLPVCLMHMKGNPRTMQQNPHYDDLIGEVSSFLRDRVSACDEAGIPPGKIILDPGFGFGKTAEHNLCLLNRLERFTEPGFPLLVGLSRKSTIGKVLDGAGGDRLMGSVAGAVIAVIKGASIVRVHDVAPTVQALAMTWAVMNESSEVDR